MTPIPDKVAFTTQVLLNFSVNGLPKLYGDADPRLKDWKELNQDLVEAVDDLYDRFKAKVAGEQTNIVAAPVLGTAMPQPHPFQ